jgi:hypothetical protein
MRNSAIHTEIVIRKLNTFIFFAATPSTEMAKRRCFDQHKSVFFHAVVNKWNGRRYALLLLGIMVNGEVTQSQLGIYGKRDMLTKRPAMCATQSDCIEGQPNVRLRSKNLRF